MLARVDDVANQDDPPALIKPTSRKESPPRSASQAAAQSSIEGDDRMDAGDSSDSSYEPSRPFQEISKKEFEARWVKYVKSQSDIGWNQKELLCPELGTKLSILNYLKTIGRMHHLAEFLLHKGKITPSEIDPNPDNYACYDKPNVSKKLLLRYLAKNPPHKESDRLPWPFKNAIESHWNRTIRKRRKK